MKKPTNEEDKGAVSVVLTNSRCKKGAWPCTTETSMIASIFLSLSHCALDIFATGENVKQRGEYGLEIPTDFHFHGPEKVIKLAKK